MGTHIYRLKTTAAAMLVGLLILAGWTYLAGSGSVWAQEPAKRNVQRPKAATKQLAEKKSRQVKRVGSVVGLNRKTAEEYVILHAHVWPEVLDRLRKSNVRNYSIFMGELDDGNLYLFSYFEYVGDDFEADMKAISEDPATQQWWKLTDPLQKRVKDTPKGDQWKTITEVFHLD